MSAVLKELPLSGQLQQHIAAAIKEAIDKRIPTLAAVGLVPPRYVRLEVAELLTGYTVSAMNHKIADGVWLEGKVWRQAPDGRRLLDLRGFEEWVEQGRPGE
jgi:hypothetical protein